MLGFDSRIHAHQLSLILVVWGAVVWRLGVVSCLPFGFKPQMNPHSPSKKNLRSHDPLTMADKEQTHLR